MTHTLQLGNTIAAIVAVFSFTMAAPAFANDSADYQSYDAPTETVESDDIYAVLNPTADRQARPHTPGRPGYGPGYEPGYGPGYEPGYGPGYGPGHGPGYGPGHGPGYGPGHGPGYGPGHGGGGYRPRVQCKAVNRRGVVFYAQGRSMPEARDNALGRCYQVSRSCWMDGCYRI